MRHTHLTAGDSTIAQSVADIPSRLRPHPEKLKWKWKRKLPTQDVIVWTRLQDINFNNDEKEYN
jgi:hypothetical protein